MFKLDDLEATSGTESAVVGNMPFMIRRFPEDALPFQFLRELIVNAIEAQATEIVVDIDWDLRKARAGRSSSSASTTLAAAGRVELAREALQLGPRHPRGRRCRSCRLGRAS